MNSRVLKKVQRLTSIVLAVTIGLAMQIPMASHAVAATTVSISGPCILNEAYTANKAKLDAADEWKLGSNDYGIGCAKSSYDADFSLPVTLKKLTGNGTGNTEIRKADKIYSGYKTGNLIIPAGTDIEISGMYFKDDEISLDIKQGAKVIFSNCKYDKKMSIFVEGGATVYFSGCTFKSDDAESNIYVSAGANVVVDGLAISGGSDDPVSSSIIMDGVYTDNSAMVDKYNYYPTVIITVSDGKITSITATCSSTNSKNQKYLADAINGIAKRLVGQDATVSNVSSVQTVSGATKSAKAIRTAGANALRNAPTVDDDKEKYTITWKNHDGSTIGTQTVIEGQIPKYTGSEPVKNADKNYSYTFKGWEPGVVAAIADAEYTATFDKHALSTILDGTYRDSSTMVEEYEYVPEVIVTVEDGLITGLVSSCPSADRDSQGFLKDATDWFRSKLVGQAATDESVDNVDTLTGATYSSDALKVAIKKALKGTTDTSVTRYTITWKNHDGTTIKTTQVNEGSKPVYTGDTPVKEPDQKNTYKFTGWTPDIENATKDAEYTAEFKSYVLGSVPDGTYEDDSAVVYSYNYNPLVKITVENGIITALEALTDDESEVNRERMKWAIDKAVSSLVGLSATPQAVKEIADVDTVAGATYSYDAIMKSAQEALNKSTKEYTVKWLNWDGETLKESKVKYGSTPVYDGDIPKKDADVIYTYKFNGWDNAPAPVTQDVEYTATYKPIMIGTIPDGVYEDDSVKVEHYNYNPLLSVEVEDGVIKSLTATCDGQTQDNIMYNDIALQTLRQNVVGQSAIPEITERIDTFSGATAEYSLNALVGALKEALNKYNKQYTITWVNDDDTILRKEVLTYGSMPEGPETEPVKQGNARASYEFAGWDKEVTAAKKDETYKALYDSKINNYYVFWENWDGRPLKIESLPYNTKIIPPEEPVRADDDNYHYTFKSWINTATNQSLRSDSKVAGSVTYRANFDALKLQYDITWVDDSNAILKTEKVAYGQTPAYDGTPSKMPETEYGYEFAGWEPEISIATQNQVYKAKFNKVPRAYSVIWKNWDGSILQNDSIAYGAWPVTPAITPVRPASGGKVYTFAGWSPNISVVKGNIEYTAQFTETLDTGLSYKVTWKNDDGAILASVDVKVGDMPVYPGSSPAKDPDEQYTYKFAGWDPQVTRTTENATYTATYKKYLKEYNVTFADENGNVIESHVLKYGEMPVTPVAPEKASDQKNTFKFDGWYDNNNNSVTAVSGDVVYHPVYKAQARGSIADGEYEDSSFSVEDPQGDDFSYIPTIYLTVENGIIKDIDAVGGTGLAGTDKAYFDRALKGIRNALIGENASKETVRGVDTVSGATFTSQAIKNSLNNIINKNSEKNLKFKITWIDGNGNVIKTDDVAEGQMPSYSGSDPGKAEDDTYTYSWTGGWAPSVSSAIGDQTYRASFKAAKKVSRTDPEDKNAEGEAGKGDDNNSNNNTGGNTGSAGEIGKSNNADTGTNAQGNKASQGNAVSTPGSGGGTGNGKTVTNDNKTSQAGALNAAGMEKKITSMKTDGDLKGSNYAILRAGVKTTKKNSQNVRWTKVKGAKKYVLYGNRCGKKFRFKKIKTLNKTFFTNKKLKKGTYYKYIVIALDKNNNVIASSKTIHVATAGGKVGNHKSVTLKAKVDAKGKKTRKAKTLKTTVIKKGKSLKLAAVANPQSKKLKVKKHRAVCFESTNAKVATVTKKGKINAKKKGTCFIYAYAQNGIASRVKVTVK